MSNNSNTDKQARRARQKLAWDSIRKLPADDQASALLAYWPQRLPKWLKQRVGKELRGEWLQLKNKKWDRRMFAMFMDMAEGDPVFEQMAIRATMQVNQNEAWSKHENDVADVLRLFDGLGGERRAILEVVNPEDETSGWGMSIELPEGRQIEDEKEFLRWIALGIAHGGTLFVHQMTALSTEIKEEGGSHWRQNERVYGVIFDEGSWTAAGVEDLKFFYGRSNNEKLPAHLVFSDMLAFSKAQPPARLN